MSHTMDLNTKVFRKDNLNLTYLVTEKKILNGILHYKLKSEQSNEILLSEFAIKDSFVSEFNIEEPNTNFISKLFSKLIQKTK